MPSRAVPSGPTNFYEADIYEVVLLSHLRTVIIVLLSFILYTDLNYSVLLNSMSTDI